MYSRENYHDVHYAEGHAEARYRASARLLRRLSGGRTRLLDFGCGSGFFLVAARAEGFAAMGVEYERSAVESAAQKTGLPVMSLADMAASGRRFEIIHLGDVLEHLPAPLETMRDLLGLLEPGGIFFVEGPLQSNPSLVYYFARAVNALKRRLGFTAAARLAPTHLILADAKAQRRFFTDALGLRCGHFEITENGWPYRLEIPMAPTPSSLARSAIGAAAVALSRIIPGWGNRFAAVLETSPVGRAPGRS